ncbi:choice-of-anchor M domain-containing protein [Streptomyces sp. NPDC003717]|uniref:choice-of-anchor M domain-containing protein n=1 Tax=Streptomyces sp. NPDC003717 TaxID=3154276 RepID=UPI0033A0FBFC
MGAIEHRGHKRRFVATAAVAATVVLTTCAGGVAVLATGTSAHAAAGTTRAAVGEPPVVSERTVIDVGHVDAVSPRMVDGTFRSLLLDDRDALDPVWRTPESVILHLTPAGAVQLSDDNPGFLFLGAPGDTVYTIPQTQDPALVWAGWSTQSFTSDDVVGDMRLSLDIVEGPGDVVLWEWSPFGEPEMILDGRQGLPATYPVPPGTHQHANWGFTQPGVYRLTFRWSAELPDGSHVEDASKYTFAVGDVDTSTVELPTGDSTPSPDPTTPTPTPSETSPSGTPSPSGGATPSESTRPSASASPSPSATPCSAGTPCAPTTAAPAPPEDGSPSAAETPSAEAPAAVPPPSGGGDSAPTGSTSGALASTGAALEPTETALAAGGLVAGGTGLVVVRARWRRRQQ